MRSEIIDASGDEPTIRDRRISVLDVARVAAASDYAEETYDDWNLSSEEIDAAIQYYRHHQNDLRVIWGEKYGNVEQMPDL